MVDDRSEQWSVPVERYPGPVCRYAITDGSPVVRGTDAAFEREFDAVRAGTTVSAVFESLNITTDSGDDIARALAHGDNVSVTVSESGDGTGSRQYLVQPVPPEGGDDGVLLFTDTDGNSETDGTLGVDHVASVVSHDLRNPLDVAKTRLRAGRELGDDEHFDHVEQAHERMERIIEDVLTLARGEDVVEPDETIDLGAVAERAWETVETHEATLSVEEPLPATVADPDRVGRLFENLFRNAIEHGAADTQSASGLTVRVGRLDEESTVGFSVADDGVGIPESEQKRVFEPGYSADDHGTGLGLAIVARIADLHGWESTVTTAADGGTRVEIHGVDPVEES
ncbi:HAMP domain-containing sensor histidine kinase [Salinibaculum salinum]|uniref:sensor histidine kinase n=1 Tax=Salinibaculum salinum TaxID=3131996 RepID=UPI0030EB2E7C